MWAVRALFVCAQVGAVSAEEFMDDGSPIRLAITIDRAARTALFDFTGVRRAAASPTPPPPTTTSHFPPRTLTPVPSDLFPAPTASPVSFVVVCCCGVRRDTTLGPVNWGFPCGAPPRAAGTGPEVFGNCNAPPAVTYSAAIYCLRCLVGADIPLNQVRPSPRSVVCPGEHTRTRLRVPNDGACARACVWRYRAVWVPCASSFRRAPS
jgi:hypothetical protein